MSVELLSALALCASLVVTLATSLQQARHERRRAAALDERWAAHLPATHAAREARSAPHATQGARR
jgi:hypothetical protein